jgi:hypothetical protein
MPFAVVAAVLRRTGRSFPEGIRRFTKTPLHQNPLKLVWATRPLQFTRPETPRGQIHSPCNRRRAHRLTIYGPAVPTRGPARPRTENPRVASSSQRCHTEISPSAFSASLREKPSGDPTAATDNIIQHLADLWIVLSITPQRAIRGLLKQLAPHDSCDIRLPPPPSKPP